MPDDLEYWLAQVTDQEVEEALYRASGARSVWQLEQTRRNIAIGKRAGTYNVEHVRNDHRPGGGRRDKPVDPAVAELRAKGWVEEQVRNWTPDPPAPRPPLKVTHRRMTPQEARYPVPGAGMTGRRQ